MSESEMGEDAGSGQVVPLRVERLDDPVICGSDVPLPVYGDFRLGLNPVDAGTDFSKMPESLGEHLAGKTKNGTVWTPRDALIDMLRRIDEGSLKVTNLVVAWHGWDDPEEFDDPDAAICGYNSAGPGRSTMWTGILERVKLMVAGGR